MRDAAHNTPEELVTIWLTITMEADYRNTGIFPGLRFEKAVHRSGTKALFRVPIDFACEVLEHAKERKRELGTGRGLYQAYRAFVERTEAALDDAEGIALDPGEEAVANALREAGCIKPGTWVLLESGEKAVVVQGYGLRQVRCEDGDYRSGCERIDWRQGYEVAAIGGKRIFAAAGQIVDVDGRLTHLRLVHG